MKVMIASDIHGSATFCAKMAERFREEDADRLLLLGDLLYHGPRNDLPLEYEPKKVIEMLNALGQRIFCVQGNCDSQVDQMVLGFPICADYAVFAAGKRLVYASHGHIFNAENPPPLCEGDILLCGHTHVPAKKSCGKFTYLNPGSVSIPKEGSAHSYMVYEDSLFVWKNLLDGKAYDELSI
ncbi:MAG: phosphodiesterase [Treponema sp.]|nr:phosphodiesterase [Treponema sp.]